MKRTFLLTLPLFLMASQNSTLDKIDALENQIQLLKKEVKENSTTIESSLPIMEKIETKSILDKVNFSPELMLRFDKLKYNNKSIEGETTEIYENGVSTGELRRTNYKKDFAIASSVRFRLNMSVDLGDVKFHGRMLYMNSSQANERLCILSRDIKSGTSGSAFDVDRAYIDYALNSASNYPFTLSFGILPTTGGTPMQYGQNKQRNSLFPALVFDMNTYGIIATQKLAKNTYARVILAKPYTLRPNFYPYQCNRENIDNANILGLYSDTKFNFLGKSLLSFGVNILNDFKAHPYLGPDVSSNDAQILGDMMTFGVGIDIEKFIDTPTTLFLHSALSNPHGNGKSDDYKITQQTTGLTDKGTVGFTEADYASGEMLKSDGYSIYLGTKYDINAAFNIGAEYNYGSKYWFSATQGAEDMYNKLAIRGQAFEVYGVWKYHKYLSAKLGLMQMKEEYTGSGWHFGEPAKKDAQQDIAYLTLEARF